MIDCTAQFAPPSLIAAMWAAEPLGAVSAQRYPASTSRRYDKMRRFPAGLLLVGDTTCSFNPVYGQGMTVAALQAVALRDCLSHRDDDLSRRFFRTTAKQIAPIWAGEPAQRFQRVPGGWLALGAFRAAARFTEEFETGPGIDETLPAV